MTQEIYLLFKIFVATWLFTHFTPLQEFIVKPTLNKLKAHEYIIDLFTCWKCASFWLTLLITQNIFYASAISLTAWVILQITKK